MTVDGAPLVGARLTRPRLTAGLFASLTAVVLIVGGFSPALLAAGVVAVGLSLIFGVTRIVNFAHGSFYMLGVYVAWTLVERLGAGLGFWPALVLAALVVGVFGAIVEVLPEEKDEENA